MKSLTLNAILIALIAILFRRAYSGILDWFDWDLMLFDNRIDPAKFRSFLGMAPKNITDSVHIDVSKPAIVKCLIKCVKEDPEQPYSRHPNSTEPMYYEYPHPKGFPDPKMEAVSYTEDVDVNIDTYNQISQLSTTFNDIDNYFDNDF